LRRGPGAGAERHQPDVTARPGRGTGLGAAPPLRLSLAAARLRPGTVSGGGTAALRVLSTTETAAASGLQAQRSTASQRLSA